EPFFLIVPYLEDTLCVKRGLSFDAISHLDAIGLVRFDGLNMFVREFHSQSPTLRYFGSVIELEFREGLKPTIVMNQVLLTKTGGELARIAGAKGDAQILERSVDEWRTSKILK